MHVVSDGENCVVTDGRKRVVNSEVTNDNAGKMSQAGPPGGVTDLASQPGGGGGLYNQASCE